MLLKTKSNCCFLMLIFYSKDFGVFINGLKEGTWWRGLIGGSFFVNQKSKGEMVNYFIDLLFFKLFCFSFCQRKIYTKWLAISILVIVSFSCCLIFINNLISDVK
jgi:hypothetical protein